jgi:uncharacterized membrane protein HdeD (DUF308 family)
VDSDFTAINSFAYVLKSMELEVYMAFARLGQAITVRGVMADLYLRGLVALLFGLAAFFWPGLTVGMLAFFFAAFVFIDGILAAILAVADLSHHVRWWGHLGEGVLGLVIGLVTFFRADITPIGLLYLMVIWALILGILEILISFWTRSVVRESWLTFINGLFALVFGLILLIQPGIGALASVRVIAFYGFVLGTMQITRAFRIGKTAATVAVA